MAIARNTKWGDRESRRLDILESATSALELGGLAGLSMRAVADGAGVSPGTVYTYFDSKEALYAVLYAERLERFVTEIAEACDVASNAAEVFVVMADRYFDIYRVFGRELNVWAMLLDDQTQRPFGDELVARLVQAAQAVFSTAWDAASRLEPALTELPAARRPLAMQVVWATMNGLAEHFAGVRHLLHDGSRSELNELAAEVLISGLKATATDPVSRVTSD